MKSDRTWPTVAFVRELIWLYLFFWLTGGAGILLATAIWHEPVATLFFGEQIAALGVAYAVWRRRGRPSLLVVLRTLVYKARRRSLLSFGYLIRKFNDMHGRLSGQHGAKSGRGPLTSDQNSW